MTEGEILIALGQHDLAIARAEKALDELPEKHAILQLRHRLQEIEAALDKADAYCRKAEALVSRAQDEATSVQEKMDAEQAKVLSGAVSNPKELQNLTKEIAALGRRKEAIEREALGYMEKAEAGQTQRARVEAALADGRAKEAGLIERFKTRGGELQRDLERMRAERALLVGRLEASTAARYESVRTAKHGIAVGEFTDGMCSACRTQLPAGEAQRVAAGPEVGECPNCRRILVVSAAGRS
ncbi:MAG: C4-type zinc ribbon domain-containing protein [Coriobacteriia bacterium]|nr:C4-type zinc ribbon domain-containing protein [Coriobacteriia bacterium]